ncbi:hypothetical protein FOA52_011208 [Chlamydomonas sp. UWO 241]|nr:hypothetical protein FOA52_011208 [Chlamydomonas sp. UWO 241]
MDEDTSDGVGHVVPRVTGDKSHFCICCSFPILVYGRLYPCLHAFCLACATDMSGCFMCHADINRIERWPKENGLFISPATLQSFKTEQDLANHTLKVHQHLLAAVQASDRKAVAAKKEREEQDAKRRKDEQMGGGGMAMQAAGGMGGMGGPGGHASAMQMQMMHQMDPQAMMAMMMASGHAVGQGQPGGGRAP